MLKRLLMLSLLSWAAGAHASQKTLLVLGDIISAAYGIDMGKGWVALLQQRLQREGLNYRVINASVRGATTRTGRHRLAQLRKGMVPAVVILEPGGNDGLRGLPFKEIEANLSHMIEVAREPGAKVLLIGIRLPPNYGPFCNRRFARLFEDLAARHGVPLVPRLLDGVADRMNLMQTDGIHPVAAAQGRILANVWPRLEPLLY